MTDVGSLGASVASDVRRTPVDAWNNLAMESAQGLLEPEPCQEVLVLYTLEVDVTAGLAQLRAARYRYQLLRSLRRVSVSLGVRVYAFAMGHRFLRLLVGGSGMQLMQLSRALKVAGSNAARAQGLSWRTECTYQRRWRGSILEGAAWVQRDGLPGHRRDALATPWTSHRDVLGLRQAPFFDPSLLRAEVDVVRLHQACSRGPLPRVPAWVPKGMEWDLEGLMRLSAAVHGVLPTDRRCVGTFVHAAAACGAERCRIEAAVGLGPRRVRHYLAQPAPVLPAVLTSLTDARLLHVP